MITSNEYWTAIAFGGTYRPEVCARCILLNSRLCTRTGCDITAQEAIAELNGGKMAALPKVRNDCPPMCACDDLMNCPVPAEKPLADAEQRWNEQRGA